MLRKLVLTGIFAVACLGSGAVAQDTQQQSVCLQNGKPVQGRQLVPPCYVFTPDIPGDIVTEDVGAIGFQPFVDILGWQAFIALNWPAPDPIVQRGVPDRQNLIGGLVSSGEGGKKTLPTGPTVWETYKDSDDIYLNPPVRPTPFDAPERVPSACLLQVPQNPAAARRTLSRTAKISEVLSGVEQSDGNRLVDQNGQNVWYEVKLNRVYYDYIVNNRYYDSRNQKGKTLIFPWSSNDTETRATVKVKAAWKVIGKAGEPGVRQPDDPAKFYTVTAFVVDPTTGKCAVRTLGLVGLHVVIKTKLLPQWLWATFEHVDNAPDQATGPVQGKQYNFFNADCPAPCPVNTPPQAGQNTPTQVVRVTPVGSEANPYNIAFPNALRTLRPDNVWQNYMLVNAQWSGTRDKIGVPSAPPFLANATLETYMQTPQPPYGCINCHGFTARTDLDFQSALNAYPRSSAAVRELLKIPGVRPGTKAP